MVRSQTFSRLANSRALIPGRPRILIASWMMRIHFSCTAIEPSPGTRFLCNYSAYRAGKGWPDFFVGYRWLLHVIHHRRFPLTTICQGSALQYRKKWKTKWKTKCQPRGCLLYTSDAADDLL